MDSTTTSAACTTASSCSPRTSTSVGAGIAQPIDTATHAIDGANDLRAPEHVHLVAPSVPDVETSSRLALDSRERFSERLWQQQQMAAPKSIALTASVRELWRGRSFSQDETRHATRDLERQGIWRSQKDRRGLRLPSFSSTASTAASSDTSAGGDDSPSNANPAAKKSTLCQDISHLVAFLLLLLLTVILAFGHHWDDQE